MKYEPLVPRSAPAPEFTQTQQKAEGFKSVSKIWWDQCLTFDQVKEQIEDESRSREDIEDQISSMTPCVDDNGKFAFRYKDGRHFYATDHALTQFGIFADVSTYFLKDMRNDAVGQNGKVKFSRDEKDAETLVSVCNNALRRINPETIRKWRAYTDGTLRAWLSQEYAQVDNLWYLDVINKIIPEGRFSHWKGDADTLMGNVLIPDTIMNYPEDDSDYGGMISLTNCEIGTKRIGQKPSIFRAICMNGCIWSATEGKNMGKVHRGKIDYDQLKKSIYENITKQIPLFTIGMNALLATRAYGVADAQMSQLIAKVGKDFSLSPVENRAVLEQYAQFESENKNLFGIINAVTRAGQTLSRDRWSDLDVIGGQMASFTRDKWDRMITGAKSLSKEDVIKAFGSAV